MNLQTMMDDLSRTRVEWERSCASPDTIKSTDWIRGVAYGLQLAMRLFHQHLSAPPTLRGHSQIPYRDSRMRNR